MRRCCERGGAIREAEVGRKREKAAAQYYSGEISSDKNIIGYYLLSAQHQSLKDIYQYLYVNFRCCSWSLFSHYTICISGAEGQHQGVLQVLSFLWFLLEICTSSLENLTRYLLTSNFSRLRPLLGAEKEGGEEIKHVNIQVALSSSNELERLISAIIVITYTYSEKMTYFQEAMVL